MKEASAYAHANIALIKYWGKSDQELNIPAVSSISMTLDSLGTKVCIKESCTQRLIINNQLESGSDFTRLNDFLKRLKIPLSLVIESQSSVPISAGLASSASFYAALSIALNQFFDWQLSLTELSKIARLGSGSAARSIFNGWAGLYGGNIRHDQAYGFELKSTLDVAMLIAVVDARAKKVSSRKAMIITEQSSPYYQSWISSSTADFSGGLRALEEGDFTELGTLMEHSTLKMHAAMWAAKPSISYLSPPTLEIINLVYQLREKHGPIAYFTMDAGPNVKILCQNKHLELIKKSLSKHSLIEIVVSRPGSGAHIL